MNRCYLTLEWVASLESTVFDSPVHLWVCDLQSNLNVGHRRTYPAPPYNVIGVAKSWYLAGNVKFYWLDQGVLYSLFKTVVTQVLWISAKP